MTRKVAGTAVVTGAASGIGRALAMRLALADYDLALLDIDEAGVSRVAEEINARRRQAIAVGCDVSVAADVEKASRSVLSRMPPLRVVWANAGVANRSCVVSGPPQGFDWVYSVNVLGVLNTMRVFVPDLLWESGPRYVGLTASVAGLLSVRSTTPAYAASKYAVIGIAEAVAAELAPQGIGVTIACPGLVNTEIWNGARARPDRYGGAAIVPDRHGERHRKQGLTAEWVAGQMWDQALKGGGYVTPVTGQDVIEQFELRTRLLREGFRTTCPRS